ncbi:MAG: hypothetical protein ACE5DX_01275 [Candidatus Dojkabacteria bacterium]
MEELSKTEDKLREVASGIRPDARWTATTREDYLSLAGTIKPKPTFIEGLKSLFVITKLKLALTTVFALTLSFLLLTTPQPVPKTIYKINTDLAAYSGDFDIEQSSSKARKDYAQDAIDRAEVSIAKLDTDDITVLKAYLYDAQTAFKKEDYTTAIVLTFQINSYLDQMILAGEDGGQPSKPNTDKKGNGTTTHAEDKNDDGEGTSIAGEELESTIDPETE